MQTSAQNICYILSYRLVHSSEINHGPYANRITRTFPCISSLNFWLARQVSPRGRGALDCSHRKSSKYVCVCYSWAPEGLFLLRARIVFTLCQNLFAIWFTVTQMWLLLSRPSWTNCVLVCMCSVGPPRVASHWERQRCRSLRDRWIF